MYDKIPEKIDSKFRYVLLAAERAEQILQGAPPKVDPTDRKIIRVAMDEILQDKVSWDYGPEKAAEPQGHEEGALEEEVADESPAEE